MLSHHSMHSDTTTDSNTNASKGGGNASSIAVIAALCNTILGSGMYKHHDKMQLGNSMQQCMIWASKLTLYCTVLYCTVLYRYVGCTICC